MSQNSIFLRLDIIIGSKNLNMVMLETNKEINIKNPDIFACVNSTPVYKIKLLRKESVNIAKVIKVFDLREMEKIKEKYCLEVL